VRWRLGTHGEDRLRGPVAQPEIQLGLSVKPGTLPITSSQTTHLWQGLRTAYRVLGFESVTKGDNVFRDGTRSDHRADQQGRRGPGPQ
jgi:hypothetical protein